MKLTLTLPANAPNRSPRARAGVSHAQEPTTLKS